MTAVEVLDHDVAIPEVDFLAQALGEEFESRRLRPDASAGPYRVSLYVSDISFWLAMYHGELVPFEVGEAIKGHRIATRAHGMIDALTDTEVLAAELIEQALAALVK